MTRRPFVPLRAPAAAQVADVASTPQVAQIAQVAHAGKVVAAVLGIALAAACTRPRLPITPAPAPASAPRTSPASKRPAKTDGVALATVGVTSKESSASADIEYLRARHLLIPVAGARVEELSDSFEEPRDGSRRHRAIDILAPRGTPVLAADDGRVLRASWNSAGGNTIYVEDTTGRVVYYYAHLDRYHDSLVAGAAVTRGDTLGFVGTTGNAPKDIPHLHFQIMRMPHDRKYWDGEPLNPYTLLTAVENGDRERR